MTFQVEHPIARKHGGGDDPDVLALSCEPCNRRKGSDICSVDPATGEVVRLFDPRRQDWREHFSLSFNRVSGRSPVGRATTRLLRMNDRNRVRIRRLSVATPGAA